MLGHRREILDKLRFKGRGIPHRTTAARRGAMGIRIVNEVLRTPTHDSVCFALDVIRCLYVYEDMLDIPRHSLDKALVSLCDRVFVKEIYDEIEERVGDMSRHTGYNDPLLDEVLVGFSIIRFREYGVFEEEIGERIQRVGNRLKNKAKRVFGSLLDISTCMLEKQVRAVICSDNFSRYRRGVERREIGHRLTRDDEEYIRNNYPVVSCVYNLPEDLDIPYYQVRRNFDVEYFVGTCCWNGFMEAAPHEETSDTSCPGVSLRELCFCLCRRRMYDLELMGRFVEESTSFERAFMRGYMKMVQHEFKDAKKELRNVLEILMGLKIKSVPEILLCVYDLLSLSHLFCGEYFECVFYLDKGARLSHENQLSFVTSYFLDCRFITERIGGMAGPSPGLELNLFKARGLDVGGRMADEREIVNNRIYRNVLLEKETGDVREIRTLENFAMFRPSDLGNGIRRVLDLFHEYTVISLYCVDGELFANTFREVVRVCGDFDRRKEQLDEIIGRSRSILRREIVSDTDKARWWMERIELDTRLGSMLYEVGRGFDGMRIGERVILVLDETTTEFPFESVPIFRSKAVYRTLSLECLENVPTTDPVLMGSVFYLLDPENNLHKTQKTISEFLSSVGMRRGVTGRRLSGPEHKELGSSDVFLYFGHGSGSRHLMSSGSNRVVFLFGCNSARLLCVRNYKRNGSLLRYLNKDSTVVGCLWEVTDRDIDRFSIKVIEGLGRGEGCIGKLVSMCRNEFKMRYLNGASVVVYGLPQEIVWSGD